jgi:predicted TIM-barrel fold metal-dependent hydrolase
MAKRGYRIVDSELHLEEPFDLWDRHLPEPYRSWTKISPTPGGHLDTGQAGIELAGKGYPPGVTKGDPTRAEDEGSIVFRQGNRKWDKHPEIINARVNCSPSVYLQGMDTEGIDVAILTPSLGFHIMNIDGLDPEYALALCRVYNDYAAEFASENPERFKFWAWLPRQAPALAAEEANRCITDLGAVGAAMTHCGVDGTVLTDTQFQPLWDELERLQAPLGIHVSGRTVTRDDVGRRYSGHPRTGIVGTVMRHAFYSQTALVELIVGGVLERCPNMPVVIMESNVSWLPWLLWRMDEKWETYGPDQDYSLSLKPSDYFRRQCYAVVDPSEETARYAIDYLGDEWLLWSSDFPHHDSPFPEASNIFLGIAEISEESKRKILWDNGVRLYRLGADADPLAPVR